MFIPDSVIDFREKLSNLSRNEILDIIKKQNPEYIKQINRIEYVFKHKMSHLHWDDGTPIEGRQVTKEELIYLVDPPFIFDRNMSKRGYNEEQQRQILVASDPVTWGREMLNLRPRAFQTLMLRNPHHRKVMRFGRRLGKALAVDTPIPTPEGWKMMGDLKVGDRVFDENGLPCHVVYATDFMENHKCYNVQFNDGSSIIADAEHMWSVETKKIRKNNARNKTKRYPQILITTEDMIKNLKVGSKNESNYSIPVAKPLQYINQDTPLSIHPYVLGYWLGDGTNGTGYVTIGDEDKKQSLYNIEQCGFKTNEIASSGITYNINGLYRLLRLNGFFESGKVIPREYLQASIDQRFELLKGLMDTDGSVLEDGTLEFCSSDETLANNVYELIVSLGIKAHVYECESNFNGENYKNRFRIYFKTSTEVFKLPRKLIRQIEKDLPCQMRRYITNITPVESVPVRCIEVDSPNHLFLAGETCIPTHNTYSLALLVLWYAYVNPEARVLVVAPAKVMVGLIFDEVMKMTKNNSVVQSSVERSVRSPQHEIELKNGSTIRFFTSGIKSGGKSDIARGQEADVIVLDEMDYMGPEDLVALLAMLQNTDEDKTTQKMLIGASTPTGQRNTFWKWNTDPEYNFASFWYPSYVNPGWDKETEVQMRLDYPSEYSYRHEVEADWGESAEGVYPRRSVDMSFIDFADNDPDERDPRKIRNWYYTADRTSATSVYVFGVDWDKYAAGVNVVVLEICNQNYPDERFAGKVRLIYREEISKGEFTYTYSVQRIAELSSIFRPKHIYVDRGAGETQLELLHLHGREHQETELHKIVKGWQFSQSIEVTDPFTKDLVKKELKLFMVDNLYKMLEKDQLRFHSEDNEMYLQLISYVVIRESSTGKPVFGPAGDAQDHAHDALLLACFAIADNYDELLNPIYASKSIPISNSNFLPTFEVTTQADKELAKEIYGDGPAPIMANRAMTYNVRRRTPTGNSFQRKMF
jgi:hypothetical protein